jgi:hypothetical protein
MKNPIKVELVETNVLTRWPCTVCGGVTEKDPILAEGADPSAEKKKILRVCDLCLKDGNIDARLLDHAARLEANAAYLRTLVGRLDVPTYAAWKAAYEEHELKWVRRNTNCAR